MREQADYISDQGWKYTYHANLSPSYIRFALAMAGIEPPAIKRHCELAYGYGVSLLIHAACNQGIDWTGTDFNPKHAAFARKLAADAGITNVRLADLSFDAMAATADVGTFDVMTSMGTWSWLGETDQAALLSLVTRALTRDGLFGLSHATLPGQESTVGLTRMLAALSQAHRRASSDAATFIPATLDDAIAFLDTNPAYFGLHWELRSKVERMREADPAHLAHEYFNRHFRPDYFAELAERLASGGLEWLSPWSVEEQTDALQLTPRQAANLSTVTSPIARQQLRDFHVNRRRRNDLFTPAGARFDRRPPLELLRRFCFVATRPLAEFTYLTRLGVGETALARGLYGPLTSRLGTLAPATLDELHITVADRHRWGELVDAVAILVAEGFIHPIDADESTVERSRATACALNRAITAMACRGKTIEHLGSPLTGAGVPVRRLQLIFLAGHIDGLRTAEALAAFAHDCLARSDADGRSTPRGGAASLMRDANQFIRQDLPLFRALMLIGDE